MALNRLMHPRNIYRDRKPDFKGLATKYLKFRRQAITDLQGKVHIDFKKPECLRALTWALLKDDWELDVDLPADRLIPTIPLRLNYLLWIEDLIQEETDVRGIDIGTGASCVYPLLGAKKNKWKFIASESDAFSHTFAVKNVDENNLQELIKVVKVAPKTGLEDLVSSEAPDVKYTFSMCNPPFFASNLEAWGAMTSRSEDRPEPRGVDTAAPGESVAPGGEVEFVRRMIQDSVKLRDRVRVYTSMLGKKTSLVPLKEELQKHGITNFGVTEFCQGRTMRWGLGWSFDAAVKFPVAPSKLQKVKKAKPPIVYKIPHQMALQPDMEYSVPDIGSKVMRYLDELKVVYEPEKSTPDILDIQMVAIENTWSNQRRKRRQKIREDETLPPKQPREADDAHASGAGNDDTMSSACKEGERAPNSGDKSGQCDETKQADIDRLNVSLEDVEEYILKCQVVVKKVVPDVLIEMTWLDGENVELMHQVLQYFRNRLK